MGGRLWLNIGLSYEIRCPNVCQCANTRHGRVDYSVLLFDLEGNNYFGIRISKGDNVEYIMGNCKWEADIWKYILHLRNKILIKTGRSCN